MANNFLSFSRFTAMPPVIARFGWTEEEAAATRGKPEGDPWLSPMAKPAVAEVRLALAPGGSDKTRLNQPNAPEANPYEGPKPTLVSSRNAVKKLAGNVVGELHRLVQGGAVPDKTLQALMLDSMRRVNGLREYMDHLNQMTEMVYVRSLAASKG
ncbi:MAG: hypothetical protein HY903_04105 [Deltaproteobacteria bacterium]|nr:hypothetical protein [Deltaproteobacteria bacterium]